MLDLFDNGCDYPHKSGAVKPRGKQSRGSARESPSTNIYTKERTIMKYFQIKNIAQLCAALTLPALALSACDVKKTQEGEAPKVKVEGGQLPAYDVEGPDVKVEGKEKTITVPDVDIVTPEEKRRGGNVEPGDPGTPAPAPAPPAPAPAE